MTIDDVIKLIETARSPRDVFGGDVNTELRRLRAVCHPDRNPGHPQAVAVFQQLSELAKQATQPPLSIKSPKRLYELLNRLAVGDISDVHLAAADGKDYAIKASRTHDGPLLLENERKTISAILAKASETSYWEYLPTLVESFLIRDRIQKRLNVFLYKPGFFSADRILAKYSDGLDGRHLAWMFKRILTILGFVHRLGFVHGAILPPHLLFNAANHGLVLVGWGQAVPNDSKLSIISGQYRDWYPQEVLRKQPVVPATDIYMAAKAMIYLAGSKHADLPPQLASFFASCLMEGPKMRPTDAWALMDDFNETLKMVYGQPRFHVLSME